MEKLAEKEAFVTLKDHKPNFENSPKCRLISPAKSELGHISKVIIGKLVTSVMDSTGVKLWRSTREVLDWFCKIPNKQEGSFVNFDIVEFYPSISEELLVKAINLASQYAPVSQREKDIIIHAKRTVIFSDGAPCG